MKCLLFLVVRQFPPIGNRALVIRNVDDKKEEDLPLTESDVSRSLLTFVKHLQFNGFEPPSYMFD